MGGDERSLGRNDRPVARPETTGTMGRNAITMNDVAHLGDRPRFMVIAAHPDDADFGPAGTAARWIDEGSVGWLVCCTSGDAGGEDPDADPLELAALREREQRAAAEIVGYAGRHLPAPCPTARSSTTSCCASSSSARSGPSGRTRSSRPIPTVVFYRDGGINHTDHREAGHRRGRRGLPGRAQPDGVPGARPQSGLAAHRVRRLYLFWPNEPNVRVDITTTAGPQDRRPRGAREPDPGAGEAGRADPEPGPPRRARRSASPAAEALRLVVIDEDEDEGPDPGLAERPTRRRPRRAGADRRRGLTARISRPRAGPAGPSPTRSRARSGRRRGGRGA